MNAILTEAFQVQNQQDGHFGHYLPPPAAALLPFLARLFHNKCIMWPNQYPIRLGDACMAHNLASCKNSQITATPALILFSSSRSRLLWRTVKLLFSPVNAANFAPGSRWDEVCMYMWYFPWMGSSVARCPTLIPLFRWRRSGTSSNMNTMRARHRPASRG